MLQCPPAALVDLCREQPGTYSKPYTSGRRQAQHTWFTCMRPRARTHTHTQGLISPTLFSGTFTAGMG